MSAHVSVRVVAITLVAVALVVAMTWLGLWQLGVYDDRQHDDAVTELDRAPVALDAVLGPDDPFPADAVGRPVIVDGTWLGAEQFFVRDLEGAGGDYAVVTPMRTAGGSAILVVRGRSDRPQAQMPAGPAEVEGVLEPATSEGTSLDAARVTDGIRIPALVSSFDEDLYGGYVVARSTTPADGLRTVEPPLGEPSRWAGLRNLLYAIQWWVFAAFVAFMWWRVLRDAPRSPGDGPGVRPRS
jgi:cytochrome oxidase assembly protein ShyY1